LQKKDANGRDKRRRGFNDKNLFVAETTQPKVAPLSVSDDVSGEKFKKKYSYAIPLEILYMNPLAAWNPYNLPVKNTPTTSSTRTGGFSAATAFQDTSENGRFYWTPAEFFDLPANSKEIVGVLDGNGVVQRVCASGTRILLPPIKGVSNVVRQRYPIPSLSFDKSFSSQNAKALKHLIETNTPENLLKSELYLPEHEVWLWTGKSTTADHYHRLDITTQMQRTFDQNATAQIVVTTDKVNTHQHQITISRTRRPDGTFVYNFLNCDKTGAKCADGHSKICYTDSSCV
jgi:hypothetical protein